VDAAGINKIGVLGIEIELTNVPVLRAADGAERNGVVLRRILEDRLA
jgi:hypothetical protein